MSEKKLLLDRGFKDFVKKLSIFPSTANCSGNVAREFFCIINLFTEALILHWCFKKRIYRISFVSNLWESKRSVFGFSSLSNFFLVCESVVTYIPQASHTRWVNNSLGSKEQSFEYV